VAGMVTAAEGALMMCDRCGQPIKSGDARTYPIDSASGGGRTATIHQRPCKRPPTQTYPSR
jgi:hypothetical protein